jgi:hypothetical protein
MALQTLGTLANNSLDRALVWHSVAVSQADVRVINANIYDDQLPITSPYSAQTSGTGGFVKEGVLYVPNRGSLTLFPGDIVALEAAIGQPILLTAYGLSAGPWTLT